MAVREDHSRLLEKRCAYERAFIQSVAEGNAGKAIQNLHSMQMDVAYLKRIGTTLENEKVDAAIVRTTARLAALQAGLLTMIADRISSENTVACVRSAHVDEIVRAQENMVRAFCKAVQELRTQTHSALVQSTLYYIEKEYAQDISMQSLAEELDVSVNHLISVFNKVERSASIPTRLMQVTPNVYLREHRLKQAARILSATDLPIQEVASAVGITDANYIIKLFKAQYGETPTAYRKKYRVNVIARRPTRQGAKLYGRPVCLEGLNKILASKNLYVEIFLELYGINHLHWRGELLPYKKITRKQLAPLVTIDTMDSFPMISTLRFHFRHAWSIRSRS